MSREAEFVLVDRGDEGLVNVFLGLGVDYFADMPIDRRERFVQSILDRQTEPDRWLFLLRVETSYIGFVHMKIDRDERPGWGFILEFYVVPGERRCGWGTRMYEHCRDVLVARGVERVWLLTTEAVPFWSSLGFRETGEMDEETSQKIMITDI